MRRGAGGIVLSPQSHLAEAPGESLAGNREAVGHGAVPQDRHGGQGNERKRPLLPDVANLCSLLVLVLLLL